MTLEQYFAGCINPPPYVDAVREVVDVEPRFNGTMLEFRERYKGMPAVINRLNNEVKVCPNCGKPCAVTLTACNACGTTLEGVEVSFTDNIFMGFVYGIASGKIPFKISMRRQTADMICFDDPLSLAMCHLNVIPTNVYCRDLRFLFANPPEGLKLLRKMLHFAGQVALEDFWNHPKFHAQMLHSEGRPVDKAGNLDFDKMRPYLALGLNFPPSMFQLHLQFIHMPHMPFQAHMAHNGNHYHHGRFFFASFLEEALKHGDLVRIDVTNATDIQEIIARCKEVGVDYDERHAQSLSAVKENEERLNPFQEADFEYEVSKTKGVVRLPGREAMPDVDPKALQQNDKLKMQNYGRPYVDDKPGGVYYKYPKRPDEVADFNQSVQQRGLAGAPDNAVRADEDTPERNRLTVSSASSAAENVANNRTKGHPIRELWKATRDGPKTRVAMRIHDVSRKLARESMIVEVGELRLDIIFEVNQQPSSSTEHTCELKVFCDGGNELNFTGFVGCQETTKQEHSFTTSSVWTQRFCGDWRADVDEGMPVVGLMIYGD